MTLQAISKGFEYYKKFGLNFTIRILPLVILFGFLVSIGPSQMLSEKLSNFDISILLINDFLISPLLIIIAIFIANDLIEKGDRDVLVYYLISWKFLIKVLILSLISGVGILLGFLLFLIPGILIAGLLLFINYYAILENKSIGDSLNLSWKKASSNLANCIFMAAFFWLIKFFIAMIWFLYTMNYEELSQIPQSYRFLSGCLAMYIQICLISFPILVLYKNLSIDDVKDRI